jgi:bacteriophage N4 adsorption protein B
MIPAWEEADVIGEMIDAAGRSINYENYHIVVGTYPNDTETQAVVEKLAQRHPMVHKVICARPGPTSKADCLNNVVARIFELEDEVGIRFEGFVLHDAEDVIAPMELRFSTIFWIRRILSRFQSTRCRARFISLPAGTTLMNSQNSTPRMS